MLLLFLLLSLLKTEITTLSRQDIVSVTSGTAASQTSPFLVFIHYKRDSFVCPLCEEFRTALETLSIRVKELNFAEDVELGSRFLQHTFPAFIVRYLGNSYVIDPRSIDELREIIKSESWKHVKPVRSFIDVNSPIVILFSKINRVIFWGIRLFHYMVNYVPDFAVTLFILGIITFLVYSIFDVFRTAAVKEKTE